MRLFVPKQLGPTTPSPRCTPRASSPHPVYLIVVFSILPSTSTVVLLQISASPLLKSRFLCASLSLCRCLCSPHLCQFYSLFSLLFPYRVAILPLFRAYNSLTLATRPLLMLIQLLLGNQPAPYTSPVARYTACCFAMIAQKRLTLRPK